MSWLCLRDTGRLLRFSHICLVYTCDMLLQTVHFCNNLTNFTLMTYRVFSLIPATFPVFCSYYTLSRCTLCLTFTQGGLLITKFLLFLCTSVVLSFLLSLARIFCQNLYCSLSCLYVHLLLPFLSLSFLSCCKANHLCLLQNKQNYPFSIMKFTHSLLKKIYILKLTPLQGRFDHLSCCTQCQILSSLLNSQSRCSLAPSLCIAHTAPHA